MSVVRQSPKGMRRTTAAVDGGDPETNRSAEGGARSSLLYGGEGVTHPPTRFKVIAGGTVGKNKYATSGELAESPGGTGVSKPISDSEMARDALSVVGPLRGT